MKTLIFNFSDIDLAGDSIFTITMLENPEFILQLNQEEHANNMVAMNLEPTNDDDCFTYLFASGLIDGNKNDYQYKCNS